MEFDTLAHARDLMVTLAEMVESSFLNSFSGPIDFMSMGLGTLERGLRGLEEGYRLFPRANMVLGPPTTMAGDIVGGIRSERAKLFDRVASRFQNSLLSLKLLSRMKMVAVPLAADDIDEVAQWSETEAVYEDKLCYAFQTVPSEHTFTVGNKIATTTYYTKRLIGAYEANQAGYTGEGVTVAVPDTGGAPVHEQTFGMSYHSTMREKGQFKDKNGHGQWCCSCIGGKYVDERVFNVPVEGVAPDVTLIGIKCLGFVIGTGFASDIIQAMEYAADQGADIVSMSLGSDSMPENPDDDPQIKTVNELVTNNIIPVIAAGNAGPQPSTIGTPGCAPNAVTVGAWNPIAGGIADFSSRGPTFPGQTWSEVKPDVISPGVDIYSGCVGLLDTVGDKVPNRYSILSGTSMATPHIAGLLALVKQYYKQLGQTLTVDMVKTICQIYGDTPKSNDSGWGFITWQWFKNYADTQGWT